LQAILKMPQTRLAEPKAPLRRPGFGERSYLLLWATLLSSCYPTNLATPTNRQNKVVAARVQGVSGLVAHRLVTVRTSSATLVTTPEHPFAKVGAGWTRAADLMRGDRVRTSSGGNATVVGVEIREVQPTVVYNLTVSPTHAYFVGSQAVLVHNTNCGGPSSPGPSRVRQREEDPNERREQFRVRRAQRKAQIEAKRREREQNRMVQAPFNDMPGQENCGYCVLAGLSDADTVSTLVRQKNIHPSTPC
jgi:Pretoxin HINT domain